ncbi:alpha-amylase family glycosyl hydrolase [Clostridium pasteurianum]|uniref:alpha-amylase family glycosyl hydrolase n=1 Tax=Clostridium pasteurianum TaxID=1501 RepID=UPI003C12F8F2
METLEKTYDWIKHIKYLGADAIYFGPIFESTSHGYDTVDYNVIDRRLGNNDTFIKLVKTLHKNNIKVVIDGVFNHVGRDFFAFKDILLKVKNHHTAVGFIDLILIKIVLLMILLPMILGMAIIIL